jgi:beta-lactamase superfamily II metal-dependent hydrolase
VLWSGAPLGTAAPRYLQVTLGQGAHMVVTATTRSGAVLLLEWSNFRAPLPIGLDKHLSQTLLEEPGPMPVNALLLVSSGAADSNPPEWLLAWEPQMVLLSVGMGDRRARPAAEVLEAIEGYTLLCTDQNGWVLLSTNGEQMWVEVERRS